MLHFVLRNRIENALQPFGTVKARSVVEGRSRLRLEGGFKFLKSGFVSHRFCVSCHSLINAHICRNTSSLSGVIGGVSRATSCSDSSRASLASRFIGAFQSLKASCELDRVAQPRSEF